MARINEFMDGKKHAKLAEQMAEERVKELHKIGMGKGISNANNASEAEKKAFEDLADKYFEVLKTMDLPENYLRDDKITIGDYIAIAESGKPASDYFHRKKQTEFKEDASKIMYGKMSVEEVAKVANKYGYDYGDLEQRKQFLNLVANTQNATERAKIIKDFEEGKDMGWGVKGWNLDTGKFGSIIAQLAYPTATDEAKKQALTGEYNDAKLYGSLATDFVAGVAEGGTPFKGIKVPIIQTSAEGARQGLQGGLGLGDEKFNTGEVVFTAGAGATTPAIKGVAQSWASKAGGGGKRVASGIESTTSYSPLQLEKDMLKDAFKNAEEHINSGNSKYLERGLGKEARNARLDAELEVFDAFKGNGKGEKNIDELYNNPTKFDVLQDDVTIPTDLKNVTSQVDIDKVGKITPVLVGELSKNKNKYDKAGVVIGNVLGNAGGRLEPWLKINSFSQLPNNSKDVTQTTWFKKLNKNQQQAIIRELQRKREEEEGLLTEEE